MTQSNPKPFLRWAGSKRKLLPVLSDYWNDSFNRYIEPFMGSACLFFALQPKKAVLGDLNSELVETYKIVRSNPGELSKKLSAMSLGPDEYYALRNQLTKDLDPIDSAARFIFLNRFCFNGLFRTNNKGLFNVPYGGDRSGQLPSKEHLQAIAKLLRKCSLKSGDFEKVLDDTREGDFVYLDPPFAVANRRVFRQYGPQNFGLEDMERLACSMMAMERRGVSFVLSYAYCSEALRIFKQWPHRKVFVQRNIAGFTTNRRRAAELIVTNITTQSP